MAARERPILAVGLLPRRCKRPGSILEDAFMRLRLATFNLENWKLSTSPTLQERIAVMRPQMLRINADILCLQEANGDAVDGGGRDLVALQQLLAGTPYETFH